MFHPTAYQSRVDVLQPKIEVPLYPISPLPPLTLSTSLFSLSTTPPPPCRLPLSTSLLCLSSCDMDPILSSFSSIPTLIPAPSLTSTLPNQPPYSSCALPSSQSPTATLQSTNTQTQSSSSSSGDGSLFRQRGSQAAQPDETGRVPPYVDFSQFYSLWGSDHCDGQSTQGGLGPQ